MPPQVLNPTLPAAGAPARPRPACSKARPSRAQRGRACSAVALEESPVEIAEQPAAPAESRPLPALEAGSDPELPQFAFQYSRPKALRARFDELLDAEASAHSKGEVVLGSIATVDGAGAWVDIGEKQPAFCPSDQLALAKIQQSTQVAAAGTQREFLVTSVSSPTERRFRETQLSAAKLDEAVVLRRLEQLGAEGIRFSAKITSALRAGYMATPSLFPGLKDLAFIPASMYSNHNPADMEAQVGREVSCRVAQCVPKDRRLILTTRVEGTKQVKPGDLVDARVEAVQPYGAFLSLGDGLTGLLHISQISATEVNAANMPAIISVGNDLKVVVLTVDQNLQRISCSTRQLEPAAGDFLKDPGMVMRRAEEMAVQFRERLKQAEQSANSPRPSFSRQNSRQGGTAPAEAAPAAAVAAEPQATA